MSYVALYRKWRPTGFNDVVGQDHIVKTLSNQIMVSLSLDIPICKFFNLSFASRTPKVILAFLIHVSMFFEPILKSAVR